MSQFNNDIYRRIKQLENSERIRLNTEYALLEMQKDHLARMTRFYWITDRICIGIGITGIIAISLYCWYLYW